MLPREYCSRLMALLALSVTLLNATPAVAEPEPGVELLADTVEVTPGQTVNLAVKFNIPEASYIFWQNPGDLGEAPAIQWTSPNAEYFGVLRFPAPEKLDVEGGGRAYVLRYEPVLLGQLTVSAEAAPGTRLQIQGQLDWVEGTPNEAHDRRTTLALSLPIVSPGSEPGAANEEVFAEAAYSMPVPPTRAKHVKLHAELKPSYVTTGESAIAVISVSINKGFHVQAHDPGARGLIGLDLFFVPPPGVTVHEPAYPEGKSREVKYLGKVNEYVGQVRLEAPLRVDKTFKGGELSGLLRYQACDEKTGVCFPPEDVAWSLNLPVGK
ncbi:MAG: hypothetical protein JSU68_06490 [Phycisphaerales bacterium]|nr:MAG: hypothetical protein JSU68_06490 [Phycisphaerales bacterium]